MTPFPSPTSRVIHMCVHSFSSCFLQEASWTPAGLAPTHVQTEAPLLRPSRGRQSGRHRRTSPWQESSSCLWKGGVWLLSWDWSPQLSPHPSLLSSHSVNEDDGGDPGSPSRGLTFLCPIRLLSPESLIYLAVPGCSCSMLDLVP